MRATLRTPIARRCMSGLKEYIKNSFPLVKEFHINLGGLKTVRVLSFYPGSEAIIEREFSLIMTDPVPEPDATVWFWRETGCSDFVSRVLGIDIHGDEQGNDWLELFHNDGESEILPMATIDMKGGRGVHLSFENDYFYGLEGLEPGTWLNNGHLFVQALFRVLNSSPVSSLVHGACVGVDGKGVLMCARGGGGKSTLSVTAMLRGFEYVSDDYLILENGNEGLLASPIYSFISLSPEMYDLLFDDMARARFLGVSGWKGKYVFDISGFKDRFRWRFPVKALLFPEIDLSVSEPSVCLCGPAERGKTIVQIAHSTISQMGVKGFRGDQRNAAFVLKTVKMLEGFDCYKITLSRDLDANVNCLKGLLCRLSQ